ncbi:MAG: hypothetical protein AB8B60_14720 [Sulfitobacter sp.]
MAASDHPDPPGGPPQEIPMPIDPQQVPSQPENPQPVDPTVDPVTPEVPQPAVPPEDPAADPFDEGNFPV